MNTSVGGANNISDAINTMEACGLDATKLREAAGTEGEWRALFETTRELAREIQGLSQAAEDSRRVFMLNSDVVHRSWALKDERMTELADEVENAAWRLFEYLKKREGDLRACLRAVELATLNASANPRVKD